MPNSLGSRTTEERDSHNLREGQPRGFERRARSGAGAELRHRLDQLGARTAERTPWRQPDLAGPAAPLARTLGAYRLRLPVRFLVADALTALVTFAAFGVLFGETALLAWESALPWVFVLTATTAMGFNGGYRSRTRLPGAELSRFGRLFAGAAVAGWLTTVVAAASMAEAPVMEIAAAAALLPIPGSVSRWLLEKVSKDGSDRTVIVGTGLVAQRAVELIRRSGGRYELVGFVDDPKPGRRLSAPLLGGVRDLPEALRRHQVDRVLVAFSRRFRDGDLASILRDCDEVGVDVDIVPRLFEFTGLEPCVGSLGDLPVVHVKPQYSSFSARFAKRTFDVLAAGAFLLLLSPVLIALALAVVIDSGRPILFKQRRVGRFGQPFDMLKFRSMVPEADKADQATIEAVKKGELAVADAVAGIKGERDPRVTRVGEFIRKTSLDELPQLWNVVRGDMSLVGPRPLRPFEVEQLDAWQLVRQRVRPGITGLWQVLGRSDIAWGERMQLDYAYVRHWSPFSDLRILAETVPVVTGRRGAR